MKFISVTKPGIIFGNLVTVTGGFFLGSHGRPLQLSFFAAALIGMALVIASGCVFNNYIDRDIDKHMERTKNRVLPQKRMSLAVALIYATLLGVTGFYVLFCWTNWLTVYVAFMGIFVYVVLYSLWCKRKSIYSTYVGGIAGAVPPVAGYCAAANRFDAGAVILFLLLFFWQLPHFYAISIYRLKDFSAAHLPILPLSRNIQFTKRCMVFFILLFTLVSMMPFFLGYTGKLYIIAALCLDIIWLVMGITGLHSQCDDKKWSKKMFLFSVLLITVLCGLMR